MAKKKRQDERESIQKGCLIFCEGIDEKNFLINWLNSEALADEPGFANDIQVLDFGGNDDLPNGLASYRRMDRFDEVRHLMIIRDAEQDVGQAIRDVQSALRKNGFQAPESPCHWVYDSENDLKIGFLLFPTCDADPTPGMLEDLCLEILAEPDAGICMCEIDSLLPRLEAKRGRGLSHEPKTRLHAYFAVSDDYVGLKVGESAKAGAFDHGSARLEPLKEFVRSMIR